MDSPSLLRQLISVANAPVYANSAGNPIEHLSGKGALPRGGLPLVDWPFGDGLARSWHGQLSPGPGSLAPIASPTGVMPVSADMPNTGYLYPPPERDTGLIVSVLS